MVYGSAPSVALHGRTAPRSVFPISPAYTGCSCGQLARSLGTFVPDFLKARGLRPGSLSPCARLSRPQTTTPPPSLLSRIAMSSGVSPFLLSTALGLLREASRVQHGRRKWNEVGGVLLSLPLPLFAAPQSWNRGEDRVTSVTIAKPFYLACLGPYAQRSFLISGSTG